MYIKREKKLFDFHIINTLRYLNEHGIVKFSQLQNVVPNPKTLSKKLTFLQEQGLVDKKRSSYTLSEKGVVFIKALQPALVIYEQGESIFEEILAPFLLRIGLARYLSILKSEFPNRIASIILFGSLAEGTYDSSSDIDLFLLFSSSLNFPSIFDQFVICRRLFRQTVEYNILRENDLDFRVQHLPYSMEDLDKFHNLFPEVIRTGVVLFNEKKSYEKFHEIISTSIEEKNLLRVENIRGNRYWRTFERVVKDGQ